MGRPRGSIKHQPDRPGRRVPCPRCAAPTGRPCVTTSGAQRSRSHVARWDAEAARLRDLLASLNPTDPAAEK